MKQHESFVLYTYYRIIIITTICIMHVTVMKHIVDEKQALEVSRFSFFRFMKIGACNILCSLLHT